MCTWTLGLACLGLLSIPSRSLDHSPTSPRKVLDELAGILGKDKYHIRIVAAPFHRSRHRLGRGHIRAYGEEVSLVDGVMPRGTIGELPRMEIHSFDLTVGGERWYVPKRLWSDLYNPNLGTEPPDEAHPRGRPRTRTWSSANQSIFVYMNGADAAAGYEVLWTLRRDGHHSRKFVGADAEQDSYYRRMHSAVKRR